MAGTVPSDYRGVVWTDVAGADEASKTISKFANEFPKQFERALGAEAKNLKKSIAATLKNYKILKATPVPNLVGAVKWEAYKFPKKDRVTKIFRSRLWVSRLASPGSVSVQSIPGGYRIGHFGNLSRYAVRFQEGVPRQLGRDRKSQLWKLYRLKEAGVVTGGEGSVETTLMSVLLEKSPPRPYVPILADKIRRDFPRGLKRIIEKMRDGTWKSKNMKK